MTDNITVNTQSSIRIEAGKQVLYVDPFEITEERHDADIIFITHEHGDHFSPEVLARLAHEETFFVAPASMHDKVTAEPYVEEAYFIGMRPGDETHVDGISVKAVAAYNLNKEFHKKEFGWVGYVLTVGGQRIYVAGDMDATPEAEAVTCDIAMIPIGGYYTMDYKEAADLINKMKPATVIPTHYGTIIGEKTDGDSFAALIDPSIKVVKKLVF